MDKTSSVIAALEAGKLPSQRQLNAIIDWVLLNIIPLESPELDKLTQPGGAIAGGLADVLDAYKQLGTNKNYDDLVQDTLWHLSEGDFSATHIEAVDVKEASADMNAFRSALRSLLKTLWANISGEGSHLLSDFTSFMRLALADFAETLEIQAAHTKESLRESEGEVQRGERDHLGRKYKTPEEEREEADSKAKFEKTMETAKEVGSKTIAVGQSIKVTAEEKATKTRSRITEAFYEICDRAQSDEEYKRALSTLFNIASKWLNRTLDTAATADEATSLDTFIDDPTEAKHVHHALINIRTLYERLAGVKPLHDLYATLRACALDIKQDKDLKAWFDDFITHMRNGLDLPGYARSQKAQVKREHLERRWEELLDDTSDFVKQWKADLGTLRREFRECQQAIADDADLRRVGEAQARFACDVEKSVVAGGVLGLQSALEQASWFWQDLFNVYTQRILFLLKNIPIPRTEYVDHEVEFVLENLNISSLNLLPGHVYMRNITDIEITAPGEKRGSTKTAFGTLTHVHLQAIQLSLRDVSFFYKDKTSTVGPNDFTGIMQFDLPTQGLDVDFKLRLIPNTEQGLAEREQCKRFFRIERADVKLAENIKFDIKESNHPIIASVFKPVLVYRFRDAIERTLEEHIRGVCDFADAIAFDTSKRSGVFADAGLGPAASLSAAIWSEIGHLRNLEGGLLTGWKATGTGIIKEGREGEPTIALGTEPQILPGEKHGPLGYGSEPMVERIPGVEIPAVRLEGRKVVERVKDVGHEGVKRVQTFKESVQNKVVEEKKCAGWESKAFDVE
ncbi:hypothetical protein EV363DRAFT_1228626 [Boletus edulis]|nr:hypothetical protein EV363DRAFT_1228626 [Boletus edulis]